VNSVRGPCGGQASVELVGGAVGLMLVGLVAFQLLAAGYAIVMADHAAEAAALALANGNGAADAAQAAVPGWPRAATEVRRRGSRVYVTLVPPSPLRLLRDRLAVTADAAVRLPPGEEPG
jgi:hypothetical protein